MFFFHWFFDFLLQIGGDIKHKDNKVLLYHTTYYSVGMTLVYISICGILVMPVNPYFFPTTWLCHTVTDYFTSRWNAKTGNKFGPGKELVDQIGLDQWFHHAQLFLTI